MFAKTLAKPQSSPAGAVIGLALIAAFIFYSSHHQPNNNGPSAIDAAITSVYPDLVAAATGGGK
jgi:hypothetical protein